MEDALTPIVVGRHGDQLVVHIIYIFQGYASPSLVVGIEMGELYTENSRLNLVETRISAAIVEDVFARRAVVGYRTEKRCKCLVVGGDGSSIAEGSEVLAWIETVAYY